MIVKDVIDFLNDYAPLEYAEEFDNAGLLVGDKNNNYIIWLFFFSFFNFYSILL